MLQFQVCLAFSPVVASVLSLCPQDLEKYLAHSGFSRILDEWINEHISYKLTNTEQ